MLALISPEFSPSFVNENNSLNQYGGMSSWLNTNKNCTRNCFVAAVLSIYYKPDVIDKGLPNITIWLERFTVQDFTTASVFHVEQKFGLNLSTLMASISVQKHVKMNENSSDDVKVLVKVDNNNMRSKKRGHSSYGTNSEDEAYLTQRVKLEEPVKKLSNGICIEIESVTEEVEEQAKEK